MSEEIARNLETKVSAEHKHCLVYWFRFSGGEGGPGGLGVKITATLGNQMTLKKRIIGRGGVFSDCSGLEDLMISRLQKRITVSDSKWPHCEKLTLSGLLLILSRQLTHTV